MNIEELRTFCLCLPGTTEDIKWEKDLCFCIGEKMYCVTGTEPPFGASFKVQAEEFEEMCARSNIIPAPYVARYKWVAVRSGDALSRSEWEHYVKQSYDLVKAKLPKKKRLELKID
ncbi:MAG: hypothetical protein HKN32_02200 [Flavobacteriales bacterium]|nr:hypothetical protein [Flavobacteriales bacterium]